MDTHEKLTRLIKNSIPADAYPALRKLLLFIIDHGDQPEVVQLKTAILGNPFLKELFWQAKRTAPEPGYHLLEGYMTDRQVIEKLKISKRTLFEWRKKGILPANIYKGRYYYHINDLLALLKKNYK